MATEIKISDEERGDWLRHPTTDAQVKNIRVAMDRALRNVLGAARTSSDPAVRGHSAEYETYVKMLRIFQEKHGSTED